MHQHLRLEGDDLTALLRRAREEHGEDVDVVRAERVRTGGLGGFFAKEHFEVALALPEQTSGASASGTDALAGLLAAADAGDGAGEGAAAGAGPARRSAMTPEAAAERAFVSVGGTRRPGRAMSTESSDFGAVLSSLRAQLMPSEPAAELSAAFVTRAPATSTGDRPWVPTMPEPVAAAPATVAPDGLTARALALGVDTPTAGAAAAEVAAMLPGRVEAAGTAVLAVLASAVADELHRPQSGLGVAPGDVVVVAGTREELPGLAAAVSRLVGPVVLARIAAAVPGSPRGSQPQGSGDVVELSDGDELLILAARARNAHATLLLLHPVRPDAPEGVGELARTAGAAAVVLAVDADSSRGRVRARVDAAGASGTVHLALTGCASAEAPATAAQARVGAAVALLDGRPATPGAWTGVLLDALLGQDSR